MIGIGQREESAGCVLNDLFGERQDRNSLGRVGRRHLLAQIICVDTSRDLIDDEVERGHLKPARDVDGHSRALEVLTIWSEEEQEDVADGD